MLRKCIGLLLPVSSTVTCTADGRRSVLRADRDQAAVGYVQSQKSGNPETAAGRGGSRDRTTGRGVPARPAAARQARRGGRRRRGGGPPRAAAARGGRGRAAHLPAGHPGT